MSKNSILIGVVGLIAGLVIGFFVANSINRNAVKNTVDSIPINSGVQNPSQATNGQIQGGMLKDVQKTIDKAKNSPEDYDAQIEAGRMYAQIQNFDEALEFFQAAQKLKPNDFEANSVLGNAYFDARQFENAEKFYLKALDVKENVTVRSDLATTFFQREKPDFERAIKEFEKALEIDEKHESSLFNLAITFKRMGDTEKAKATLERLKTSNPESSLIQRLETSLAGR